MQGMQLAVEPVIYEVERSPQARYATLAKMVSMDYYDSEDGEEIIGGGEFEESSPAPKGYGHLPLGPTVSETHSPVSSPSTTTHTTSGGSASTSTSQLEIGLGLGLVAPAISGVRYITDEELAKSRIIFNWPMTQDNKPFSVGNGAS
ncbi:hypothetical protein TrLO_g1773 [Triparma laevis f. longispina]|uniref:Uncharacterized protein n=1 Tax=Triparma laevis f. longispina TaxID=1714387 RepID=A0A9W7L0J2_9STRA|nr:hypothetical protein TrLO_g1773 [Triparma laevis f. longispina]